METITGSVMLWYSNWFGSGVSSEMVCPTVKAILNYLALYIHFSLVPDKPPRCSKGESGGQGQSY